MDALLQKRLHSWQQGNSFIEHRIAAGGVRADADEVAVALETRIQLLLEWRERR
jgi:hypothetical protein